MTEIRAEVKVTNLEEAKQALELAERALETVKDTQAAQATPQSTPGAPNAARGRAARDRARAGLAGAGAAGALSGAAVAKITAGATLVSNVVGEAFARSITEGRTFRESVEKIVKDSALELFFSVIRAAPVVGAITKLIGAELVRERRKTLELLDRREAERDLRARLADRPSLRELAASRVAEEFLRSPEAREKRRKAAERVRFGG